MQGGICSFASRLSVYIALPAVGQSDGANLGICARPQLAGDGCGKRPHLHEAGLVFRGRLIRSPAALRERGLYHNALLSRSD